MIQSSKPRQRPLRLHSRRLVCENTKWNVYFDHIGGAEGREVSDYLVLASKVTRPDLITGVSILPICNDRVVLLEIWRHGTDRFSWEAPRGFVDAGESPKQSALRELREETGLHCDEANLVPLGVVAPEASTIAGLVALFAATRCTEECLPDTDSEPGLGAPQPFTFKEVTAMADDFRLQDPSTLIAFYRYLRRRTPSG